MKIGPFNVTVVESQHNTLSLLDGLETVTLARLPILLRMDGFDLGNEKRLLWNPDGENDVMSDLHREKEMVPDRAYLFAVVPTWDEELFAEVIVEGGVNLAEVYASLPKPA